MKFNLYTVILSRVFTGLLVALFLFACKGGQVEPDNKPVVNVADNKEDYLKHIKEVYQPSKCFSARFLVEFTDPKKGVQKANGRMRVDNPGKRMRMQFNDTVLGLTLSQITIRNEIVYMYNKYAEQKKVKIPVDRFYFQLPGPGGRPSASFSFKLFQDFLFARLPPALFSPQATVNKKETQLNVSVIGAGENYSYNFIDNRLRSLIYTQPASNTKALVNLNGQFRETIFPKYMEMILFSGVRSAGKMKLTFRKVYLDEDCSDKYFPTF